MKIQRITYLSLGTNQGNKLENLQNAINLIAEKVGVILKIASVYKTASWGFDSDDFYNTCLQVSTYHPPEKLISILLDVESELGRKRNNSDSYSDRNIDIDILLFDDEIIFSKTLIVPHSKMLERKFVLVPLAEIASAVIHPITKQKITVCLQICDDTSEISAITEKLKRPIPISEKYNYIAKNFSLLEPLHVEIKSLCKGVDLTILNYLIYSGLQKIKENGLENYAVILDAPLVEYSINEENYKWYDLKELKKLGEIKFDMAFIDGPPTFINKLARFPFFPKLNNLLNASFTLIVDDSDREDEQIMVKEWVNLDSKIVVEDAFCEKGALILRKN